MFLGRTADLAFLENQYHQKSFSFVPIYGRRRVGKTTLIKMHLKGKPFIYFQTFETSTLPNLAGLSKEINRLIFGTLGTSLPPYSSLNEALEVVTKYIKDHPCALVIDEFPYLAKVIPESSSIIQYFIDHYWKEVEHFQLILCGSTISFMERQVLGHKSPLYGRKTGQIKLKPFSFKETISYFPSFPIERIFGFYGITGGVPQILRVYRP